MKNELNKSKQYFRSVGVVNEINLKLEESDLKWKDADGNEQKTKGERIYGSISLRTPKGVHTFNAYFQSLSYDGTPAKNWKMATEMLKWNPEINGNGDPATLVAISGQVEVNDYVKEDTVYSNLRWKVSKATTKVGEDEPQGTTLGITAFVHKIEPEKVNDDETGRLKLYLLAADGKGACFPVDVIVEKELADDVEELLEKDTTVPFTLNRVMRHVGQKKKAKRMIGGDGDVAVNTGFDVEELILVGADEPIDEPDETEDEDGNPIDDKSGYINPAVMKKAIKVRATYLDELKANPPQKKNTGKADSFQSKKAQAEKATKGKALGKTDKPPFDMGDDGDPDW